ncbi:MAG: hypothetical protein GX149_06160, partial [Acholeplasmataceae bacterium]|nr:hypothetical protein [Acholeplasmataceae bacterium]
APIGGTAPYTIYIYDTNDLSSSIRGYTNVDSGATKTTTILQQGTYLVEVIDQYGCTYMQLIDIIEPIEISHAFSVTACDSYYWIDSNYTTSGIYTKILIAPNGCDSIVTLNLTINYTVMSTFNANSCADYTWAQNGQTYSQSGQYRDTIIGGAANGCDSIVVLNLYIPPTPISALISSTDIDCYQVNNGTITITPMGGDAPYKILIFDINDLSSSIRGYNSVLLGDYRTATGLPAGTFLIEIEDNYGCSYVENITLTEPPQLSANISILHPISCYQGNDGLLSVTTTGGTLPYAYLWQNGETGSSINGLNAGNYSVIVTDGNGCTTNANILLTEPQEITFQFSLTACNSYYWVDSNYTRSGTYTKYLTAQNGCDSIVTLNLTINYTAISTFNANSCADYTWAQNGQTYYQSGQYRDTIMGGAANGCDSIVILNLHIPATPISASILSTDIDCYQANNGTITITPTGGDAPYNILIFDINDLSSSIRGYNSVSLGDYRTATGLPAGTYLIEINDNYGCSYVENVTLTEPSQLIANISILNPVSCYQSMDGDLSVNVTGGTPSYSYLWNEGSTNNTIHGLSGGSYSVTIIDNNGCTVNANISLTEPQEITSQFSLIACDSYYWEGTNYTNSGTYTKTLTALN